MVPFEKKIPRDLHPTEINMRQLLQGKYEIQLFPQDLTNRKFAPDFAYNILNRTNFLYKPIADRAYLQKGGKRPVWPDGKRFAVCLTHDVDNVSTASIYKNRLRRIKELRVADKFIPKSKAWIKYYVSIFKSIHRLGAKDPLHSFEKWLQVENDVDAYSTFFFWPGYENVLHHHSSDCTYNLDEKINFNGQLGSVAEMIKQISSSGWEVGLHASWFTYDNQDQMRREKAVIEKAINKKIQSVRNHYLHYDMRVTPATQCAAGFTIDSTLGFNDNIGFRFGTSYPWFLYDNINKKKLSLLELPLIVQDTAILHPMKGLRLDPQTAKLYIEMLLDEIEKVGGVFTLLWHPNWIIRETWWQLYVDTLALLKDRDPWFATISEVGKWWKDNNCDICVY